MIEIDSGGAGAMAEITITVDEQELARAQEWAREAGLSVEEWVRQLLDQNASLPPVRPHDPLFGIFADDPEAVDAIDAVVAERAERYKPHFKDL